MPKKIRRRHSSSTSHATNGSGSESLASSTGLSLDTKREYRATVCRWCGKSRMHKNKLKHMYTGEKCLVFSQGRTVPECIVCRNAANLSYKGEGSSLAVTRVTSNRAEKAKHSKVRRTYIKHFNNSACGRLRSAAVTDMQKFVTVVGEDYGGLETEEIFWLFVARQDLYGCFREKAEEITVEID